MVHPFSIQMLHTQTEPNLQRLSWISTSTEPLRRFPTSSSLPTPFSLEEFPSRPTAVSRGESGRSRPSSTASTTVERSSPTATRPILIKRDSIQSSASSSSWSTREFPSSKRISFVQPTDLVFCSSARCVYKRRLRSLEAGERSPREWMGNPPSTIDNLRRSWSQSGCRCTVEEEKREKLEQEQRRRGEKAQRKREKVRPTIGSPRKLQRTATKDKPAEDDFDQPKASKLVGKIKKFRKALVKSVYRPLGLGH